MSTNALSLVEFPRRLAFFILLQSFILQATLWAVISPAFAASVPPPSIENVSILTPTVARYEKFEVEFDISTVATHFNLPYDGAPPPGIQPGAGVTVDGLFSTDNWKTTVVQPAFYYQPYRYTQVKKLDHFTPDGAPRWMVRFAPRAEGDWQMRLRVRDAAGEAIFPKTGALPFRVEAAGGRFDGLRNNPYTRHGFLRVSKNDPRYFEFEDGTPFLGVGYNAGSEGVVPVQQRYRNWQLNGIQFARVWMSGAGINASQWTPWAFPSQPFNFGLPATLLDSANHFDDSQFSFRLTPNYPCLFTDFWQGGIPVEPNTTYSLTVRAKLTDVTPKDGAPDAGFAIALGGWTGPKCSGLQADPLLPRRVGTTDWFTDTVSLTTGKDGHYLNYLYLALQNVESGRANVDSVRLFRSDDPAQVNLLRHPQADSHLYYDSMNAAEWDLLIEQAAEHGVFLKIVSDEKNEWIRNSIQKDGTIGKFSNNNFYAADDTAVRWLDQAWWRYLIARWGYSTAIHSFEFVNEGDPYNGYHYDAADAMARYFHENDPSQHMVTTSLWHSFPNAEFWSNPGYSALDYADIHAYISTGWGPDASFVPAENVETRPEDQFHGMNSVHLSTDNQLHTQIHPRGLTLNEPGEWTIRYWMKEENFKTACGYGEEGSSTRVYWVLDGGQNHIVPANLQGKDFICSSPDGTFDWREFSTLQDRSGRELPLSQRLVLSDTLPHSLIVGINSGDVVSGDAWIANVELISPSGKRTPVLGEFDNTPFENDTAWLTAAYSQLWGGASPVGAHKPLVRGETGVNNKQFPNGLPALNQDRDGIWLHNFIWGQINPGGMYDLWWWGTQNIEDNPKSGRTGNLYPVFLPYSNFIAGIPLNNGTYRDANAVTSDPHLRAWGQRDDKNGRAHLWIQNRDHDWKHALEPDTVRPISGTVRLLDMPPGTYRVEWWNTYRALDPIIKTENVQVETVLELKLPVPLTDDIAVKVSKLPN